MIHILFVVGQTTVVDLLMWRSGNGDVTNWWTNLEGWSNTEIRVIIRDSGSNIHSRIIEWSSMIPEYICNTKGVTLAHPVLHIRHSSFPGGVPLFPVNSSYCLSNSILIHCELTSQFQPFRYDKSSQTTLEFNFTHSPGPNHSEIQGAPAASLRRWWVVCSCLCRPWCDGRFSGWHWDYVRLISFNCLARLLFLVYLLLFLNHSSFSLVLLNVAMQTVECWMRCWVLSYDLKVDNEQKSMDHTRRVFLLLM